MPLTLRFPSFSSSRSASSPSPVSTRSLGKGVLSSHGDIELDPYHDSEKEEEEEASTTAPASSSASSSLAEHHKHKSAPPTRNSTKKHKLRHHLLGGEPTHKVFEGDEEAELAAVQKVYNALTPQQVNSLPDDAMVVRHLRAEDGNVDKAIAKLRAALEWRADFGVHDLIHCMEHDGNHTNELAEIMKTENETGKIYVRGFDVDGRAFMYMRPGRENTMNEINNMRHLVWNLEKAIACTARQSVQVHGEGSEPLEKINLLIDYDGFKLRDSPPLSTSKYTLDILQKHYPERMYRAYVLNPPLVFKTFWAIIKPFVDPTTKEKIVFCHGKTGMEKLRAAAGDNADKLEPVAGGKVPVRDFNSDEYLHLPFNVGFDE